MQACLAELAEKLGRRLEKPFLLCGKGPSLDLVAWPPQDMNTFCLNDTMARACTIGHCIDADVLSRVEPRCEYLLVPTVMNLLVPGDTKKIRVPAQGPFPHRWLADYHARGKLVVYEREALLPIVDHLLSSIPALSIMGELGIKRVYTAGIDGGTAYAREFAHLKPLANTQPSFDVQFAGMARVAAHWGMTLEKLKRGPGEAKT